MSTNTYIEFSFQKSLRKYEKNTDKKNKNHQKCHNNNNLLSIHQCESCMSRLYRNNSIQSTDRKCTIKNSRMIYNNFSLQKAREYSATKRNKQAEEFEKSGKSNNSKLNKSNRSNFLMKQPLSEFSILEKVGISEGIQNEVSRFNQENGDQGFRECKKRLFELPNETKYVNNQMKNQLSIEKKMELQQFDNIQEYKEYKDEVVREQEDFQEEQEKSFSHIQIIQPLKQNKIINQLKIQQNLVAITPQNQFDIKITSYAYFSSCSSLSQNEEDELNEDLVVIDNKQNNNPLKISSQTVQQKTLVHQTFDSVRILKLQSKQQLKKEYRQEYRQRLLNSFTKCKKLQDTCNECQDIAEGLKKELYLKDSLKINQDSDVVQKNDNQNQQIKRNQQQKENLGQKIQGQESIVEEYAENKDQNLFKRAKSFGNDDYNEEKQFYTSIRKKYRKLNFQIQQNYQCLGRIKIYGLLQNLNQSLCLSIRRFSSTKNRSQQNKYGMDKQKIINYLISQRPGLQKNKNQLLQIITELIEHNSLSDKVKKYINE